MPAPQPWVFDQEGDFVFTAIDGNLKFIWDTILKLALWQDEIGIDFDTTRWTAEAAPWGTPNGSVAEVLGYWNFNVGGNAGANRNWSAQSIFNIFGDFDISIDCNSWRFPVGAENVTMYFGALIDLTHYAFIVRTDSAVAKRIQALDSVNGWGAFFNTVVTTFKLRLTRTGNVFRNYYDVGAGWVLLDTNTAAIGAATKVAVVVEVKNAALVDQVHIEDFLITGSDIYWPDSPQCNVIDSTAGAVEYCLNAGEDSVWNLFSFSAADDWDGGSIKFRAAYGDSADRASATWIRGGAWLTEDDLDTNINDLDGHRYIFLQIQFNSDGTQQPNLTSITFSGLKVSIGITSDVFKSAVFGKGVF